MSRIGKIPVALPSGVTVKVDGNTVSVKGAKGELSQWFDDRYVAIEVKEGEVEVSRSGDTKLHRSNHGLYRSLINNMVTGVHEGFSKELEIVGVGYQAKAQGSKLTMQIGFCHPVEFEMPKGLSIETPSGTRVIISGLDKQMVGQMAANIRKVRPPEPYKGKGIKYLGEHIRRKAGKAVAGK